MKICKRMISDGAFENALIIGAEKLSAFVNWEDRTTCVLFGDGAGAAVLRRAEPGEGEILATEMGTDGNLTHLLNIPGGGSACPITADNVGTHLATLAMQGKEVFKHAVNRMKEAAETVISRANLQPEDIACVIPHQANLRIIDAIADRLAVPEGRVFVNLDKYGNTSAAAVAIALDEANRSGVFKRGDNIVLVVFGAGLTWAAARCALVVFPLKTRGADFPDFSSKYLLTVIPTRGSFPTSQDKAARLNVPLGFGFFPGIIGRVASFLPVLRFRNLPSLFSGLA